MNNRIQEPERITISPYTKLWNTPIKIHSIDNIKLLIPVNPWELLYFIIGAGIGWFIGNILNMDIEDNFVIRYILFPYLFVKFLTNIKLDGKKPHKFFLDLIIFTFLPKKYERFSAVKKSNLKGFKGEFIIFRSTEGGGKE